jgi:hypothetical protein
MIKCSYRDYWIETQFDGEVWVYENASEFDAPYPVKICRSEDEAVAWIERGLH